MPLIPGSTVGPYTVVAPLGEGAMGVVFRARDSRLQRDVALKLLPDHFANEPDRMSRFQREAQVLASLNHTNIAQIYGLEQVEGSTCIVMELVEGETLADRLKKGPLSYDETLDISRQISEALAAAHERGVVHRDLKPANIKVTPSGTVKVLDFGLAKSVGPKAADTHLSAMPTVAGGSVVGAVIGTPGYMSPEQARGKEVDARTDIWAFGCILYEMLTARQAFDGETVTDVMAKIVTSAPDLNLLPADTPAAMRQLLSATLNKSTSQRLQHIGDSRLFLDGTLAPTSQKAEAAAQAAPRQRGNLMTVALLAALVLVAIPAALYFRGRSTPASQMRFDLSLPAMVGSPTLSPDGQAIGYVAEALDGKRTLWIRPVNSDVARQLAGTEGGNGFLWSPDSRKIAFLADGKLKKIDANGGSVQLLASVGQVLGAAWNRDGVILLARTSDNVISKVQDSGGPITPVTKLDAVRNEALHALPEFLPDGNHFIYVAAGGKLEESGVFLAALDSTEPPARILALQPNRLNGMAYVSGHLLYTNNGRLTAHRMDANGKISGDPIVIADDLDGSFSVSQNGLLTYHKAAPSTGRLLQWFDRNGKQLGQIGAVGNYGNVDLSAKGDRAAVDMTAANNRDIWVIDLDRAVPQRVTFDPGSDWSASWSPDGSRVAFAASRSGYKNINRIVEKSSTGAGEETPLPPDDASSIPVHWSPDNKYIVFSRLRENGSGYDTWLLPLTGERKPTALLESPFEKLQARVSPDGRFIAYCTNESGTFQVVVQTFPDPTGGKWQISGEGGVEPKWRHDGRELYYLALDGKMMAVPISGPAFQAGKPAALFQTTLTVNRTSPTRDRRYDVAPDGRFIMVTPAASAVVLPTTVVVNWTAGIDK